MTRFKDLLGNLFLHDNKKTGPIRLNLAGLAPAQNATPAPNAPNVGAFAETVPPRPDQARAHTQLGSTLQAKGDLVGAITEFRMAIHLKPDLVQAHACLAVLLGM